MCACCLRRTVCKSYKPGTPCVDQIKQIVTLLHMPNQAFDNINCTPRRYMQAMQIIQTLDDANNQTHKHHQPTESVYYLTTRQTSDETNEHPWNITSTTAVSNDRRDTTHSLADRQADRQAYYCLFKYVILEYNLCCCCYDRRDTTHSQSDRQAGQLLYFV
jgi:hypothetical protein